MIELGNNAVRHLALLRRHVIQVLESRLSPHGLGHGSYKYLYALYLNNRSSQQSLADIVGDDKAAATRALVRLERQGLIARAAADHDRRVTLVSLTEAGVVLRPVVEQAVADALASMTDQLTDSEGQQFKALLAKAAAPLETLTTATSPLSPSDPATKEH